MKEIKSVKKQVGDCTVTIAFIKNKNPELKSNLLWYLTQCYEDRIQTLTKQQSCKS